MYGSRDFGQSYLVLSLFYSLQRGSNGFIAKKTILIVFLAIGGLLFSRGGVNFFQGGGGGVQMQNLRNQCTCLLFSGGGGGGGGVRTPYPPLDPHMSKVIITGQYLSQSCFLP